MSNLFSYYYLTFNLHPKFLAKMNFCPILTFPVVNTDNNVFVTCHQQYKQFFFFFFIFLQLNYPQNDRKKNL